MRLPTLILLAALLFCTATLFSVTITDVEYFFDSDPGEGNGTPIYGRNTLEFDEQIDASALEPGLHRLYVRSRNDSGYWSLPQGTSFFIPYPATSFNPQSVESVEYFFDADPGEGNGTSIYGRSSVAVDELLATSGLASGLHRLYVRACNSLGLWSLPQSTSFFVPFGTDTASDIVQLEYFLDTDPGFGLGTPVAVTPGTSVSVSLSAFVSTVEHGNHTLYIRGKNDQGIWGLPSGCQFSDGIPAFLTISENEGMVTVSWQDLFGIDTYKVYSAPLPSGTFAEDASGTFGDSSWTALLSEGMNFYRVTSIYEER